LALRDLLVLRLGERAVFLEEGLGGDAVGQRLVGNAHAGALGADLDQLLIHQLVEHCAPHLRVLHEGRVEVAAELLAIDIGLPAQRLLVLVLGDAGGAHADHRFGRAHPVQVRVDPEEAERHHEEQDEEPAYVAVLGECPKVLEHGISRCEKGEPRGFALSKKLAEWTGLEPATPGVTGRYSNQLNYHSRT
jgi:hypothetical protein